MEKLCVIKIRSTIRASRRAIATIDTLGPKKLYNCSLLDKTPVVLGALESVQNLVTYGEINKDTLEKLLKRRSLLNNSGRYEWKETELSGFADAFIAGKKKLSDMNIKNLFMLHPPIGGFSRKGKKTPFGIGGDFGYRGDKINGLLNRMI